MRSDSRTVTATRTITSQTTPSTGTTSNYIRLGSDNTLTVMHYICEHFTNLVNRHIVQVREIPSLSSKTLQCSPSREQRVSEGFV